MAPTPDLVLSSTAARALDDGGTGPRRSRRRPLPLEIERALYQADPDDIVDRLRLLTDEIEGVMIVGHNPTFADLALLLVSADDSDGRARLEDGFPDRGPGPVALDVSSWSAVAAGCGRLEEFFFSPPADPR